MADVVLLPGLSSEKTIKRGWELFIERHEAYGYDGFEVWDLARFIYQCSTRRLEHKSLA
jgi:hypothetical protein